MLEESLNSIEKNSESSAGGEEGNSNYVQSEGEEDSPLSKAEPIDPSNQHSDMKLYSYF